MANLEKKINENHDEIEDDDDDDQLNVSCQIVPTMYNTTTQEPHTKDVSSTSTTTKVNETNEVNIQMDNLIKKEPEKYIYTAIPKDYAGFAHCTIKYNRGLLSKTYSLYFDGQNENDQTFILTARKHTKIDGHYEYYIGNDEKTAKNLTDENCIARLRSTNITGTEYIFYNQNNQQSVAIIYDTHIFGSQGPRKLTVLLSDVDKPAHPSKVNETIIEEWRAGRVSDLIEIKNRTPIYDEFSKSYSLVFHENRVKKASHKNFQLIAANENGEDVILQFGRIDENRFALDYRYPLTAMQAFAITLSSFHHRFRT